ncbi:hypothetical protein DXG01_015641 [Tephrocybe rancida]|nr:hypothetical protein DXG01_015641 [Tephrocybe rancida]
MRDDHSSSAPFEERAGEEARGAERPVGRNEGHVAAEGGGSSRSGNLGEESAHRMTGPSRNSKQTYNVEPHAARTKDYSRAPTSSSSTRWDQREIDKLREELQTAKREKSNIMKELDHARYEGRGWKNEVQKVQSREAEYNRELASARQRVNEFAAQYDRQAQELRTVKEQFDRAEVVHQQTRQQLAERTAELQSAELFINQADPMSGADTISMAAALNAEILQGAALMADSLDRASDQETIPDECLPAVQRYIGEYLTKALLDQRVLNTADFDPTPVQLALQTCFVTCCKNIIVSWTLRGDDSNLRGIYAEIWKNENQSAAGRWRSMTQAHAAAADDGFERSRRMILNRTKEILIVAGVDYKSLEGQLHERLPVITTLALRLRSAVGRQVTSMDIYPLAVGCGENFDPSSMEDTYEDQRRPGTKNEPKSKAERVAGSTELGLGSRVKLLNGKIEGRVMLKSKSLAQRGAHVIALSPHPIDSPKVTIIISLLRATFSNEEIYAEQCDLASPSSIRSFCTRFLTGSDQRIDAIIFAHEYQHIGSSRLLRRTQTPQDATSKREAESLATFLITTLLLPALLVAPVERDIRVITVVNPFYAAAVGPSFTIPFPSQSLSVSSKSTFLHEGTRSLRTTIFMRHLQRILDALPAAQVPKTDEGSSAIPIVSPRSQKSNIVAVSVSPGIGRADTIAPLLNGDWTSPTGYAPTGVALYLLLQPLLWLLTKSPTASVQTVLHALFLPTPFKVLPKTAPTGPTGKGTPIDASVTEMPEEVLKPGALYAECAVVRLKLPTPTDPLVANEKSQKKGKGKQGLDEVLEIPDDAEYGGEVMGRLVWEAYEDALKAWEAVNPPKEEAKEAAPDSDQDHKTDLEAPA